MAHSSTDDYPVRITSPDYKTADRSELEAWLRKEAAAVAGGVKPEDNEDSTTAQYSELYEPPAGAKKLVETALHTTYPNGAASQATQREVLDGAFASTPATAKAEQALLSANFEHARTGDFETQAPLLRGERAKGKVAHFLSDRTHLLGLGK